MLLKSHAYLPASSAKRWMNCPGSPFLEHLFPEEEESLFATEGSLAHALAEERLTDELLHKPAHVEQARENARKFYRLNPGYSTETEADMERYIDSYVDFVTEQIDLTRPYKLWLEQRMTFGKYIPDGFGTSDVILLQGDTLHIIDLKYGLGVEVYAERNPQLMIYALGAYSNFVPCYATEDITHVKMSIFQPRRGHMDTYEISNTELEDWAENELTPKASHAYICTDEFHAGSWCQFCRAAGRCRENGQELRVRTDYLKEHELSPEERSQILSDASFITESLNQIQKAALADLIDGQQIPGWKAVLGTSQRKFDTNKTHELEQAAEAQGWDLMTTKLISPAQAEKKFGKAEVNQVLGSYILKPEGKPRLAKATDKRPAYNRHQEMLDLADELFDDKEAFALDSETYLTPDTLAAEINGLLDPAHADNPNNPDSIAS